MKSNKIVEEALKHYGENYEWSCGKYGTKGCAWCSIFVWAIFNELGCVDLIGGIKSSYVNPYENWFRANYDNITDLSKVRKGDIVFFDWDKDKDEDHIGIIIEDGYSVKEIKTIEGNTTKVAGKDEGWKRNIVNKKTRYKSDILAIYRPKYEEEPIPQPTPQPTPEIEFINYAVRKGDTFWELAKKYLGDGRLYTVIMEDNGYTDARQLKTFSESGKYLKIRKLVD